jgi:hypothetical protein
MEAQAATYMLYMSMRTSHLLIHPLYLQPHKYKDQSLVLVPNNYHVLSFLEIIPHIHENMMLPKLDVFVTLTNDGHSMDKREKHWSMIVHGGGTKHVRIEEDTTSG